MESQYVSSRVTIVSDFGEGLLECLEGRPFGSIVGAREPAIVPLRIQMKMIMWHLLPGSLAIGLAEVYSIRRQSDAHRFGDFDRFVHHRSALLGAHREDVSHMRSGNNQRMVLQREENCHLGILIEDGRGNLTADDRAEYAIGGIAHETLP